MEMTIFENENFAAANGDAAEASGAKLNLTTGRDRFASSGLLGKEMFGKKKENGIWIVARSSWRILWKNHDSLYLAINRFRLRIMKPYWIKKTIKWMFRFYPPVKLVCRPAKNFEQIWDGCSDEFVKALETQSDQWVAVPRTLPQWALRLKRES